jgi:nitrilase
METVKAAAVQAAPVLLDRGATVEKVIGLTEQAAGEGARLVVFPEAFVPGYPDWVWRTRPWEDPAAELHARLLDQAVVVGSPATDALSEAAQRLGVWLAIGVDEREPHGATLYNTVLYFAPNGTLAGRHRKLVPTGGERLAWGQGDGSTLSVLQTSFGRIGGLICWENYMPLARMALYAQGIDIWLAPTWDNSDVWVATMRHLAKEGRMYVVGVNSCIRATDLPPELPGREKLYGGEDDWLSRGNTVIVDPLGEILAGPLVEAEGIIYADVDAGRARAARDQFDVVGHYSRPDVFHLITDTAPRSAVTFTGPPVVDGAPQRLTADLSGMSAPPLVSPLQG